MNSPNSAPIDIREFRRACSTCSLRELCLPAGLHARELEQVDRLVNRRHTVKSGQTLYRAGSKMQSVYAIRSGFMKSSVLVDDGREQVTGFHMMGDLVGLDAIGTGNHMCDATALEDSEVCEITLPVLETLSRDIPTLQRHFHRIMSREIVRDHDVMLMLGSMRAEERLASFLLNLSQRLAERGYSPAEFNLRMTREEIGSYLGLKLETVSRALSQLRQDGIIQVRQKNICITDLKRLRALACHSDAR